MKIYMLKTKNGEGKFSEIGPFSSFPVLDERLSATLILIHGQEPVSVVEYPVLKNLNKFNELDQGNKRSEYILGSLDYDEKKRQAQNKEESFKSKSAFSLTVKSNDKIQAQFKFFANYLDTYMAADNTIFNNWGTPFKSYITENPVYETVGQYVDSVKKHDSKPNEYLLGSKAANIRFEREVEEALTKKAPEDLSRG